MQACTRFTLVITSGGGARKNKNISLRLLNASIYTRLMAFRAMAYKSGLSEREPVEPQLIMAPHNAVGAHSVVADVCSQTANISSNTRFGKSLRHGTTTFQKPIILAAAFCSIRYRVTCRRHSPSSLQNLWDPNHWWADHPVQLPAYLITHWRCSLKQSNAWAVSWKWGCRCFFQINMWLFNWPNW